MHRDQAARNGVLSIPMKLENKIGDRLREVREILGKTQREMAVQIGAALTELQDYENNSKLPGSAIIESMRQLGVSKNWLLTGQGQAGFNQENDDDEFEPESMDQDEFWSYWQAWVADHPARPGWAQIEIIQRFPEFTNWLKKRWLLSRQNLQDERTQSRVVGDDST